MSSPGGGGVEMVEKEYRQALPRGDIVKGYRLLQVLGVGGFGVTYLGEDIHAGKLVAIKEYFPNEFAVREGKRVVPKSSADGEDFDWGLRRFVDEAKTLARLKHPNIVEVLDSFESNSTAYIGMRYEEGLPLNRLLQESGPLSESLLKKILLPLADGLQEVHAAGYLHRDIKPSNVYVRRADESPVLLDFGSARQALGRRSRTLTAVVSPGYSPPEQYETDGEQGAWSDVYALAALCRWAITGQKPVVSLRRLRMRLSGQPDPMPSLEMMATGECTASFLGAVDWGLRLEVQERPQSVAEWLAAITGRERLPSAKPPPLHARPSNIRPSRPVSSGTPIRIGRARDVDVRVESQSVSRAHAELMVFEDDPGRFQISDLGSTNGTFVRRDGQWRRIERELVAADEPLRIGDFETTAMELQSIKGWPAVSPDEAQATPILGVGQHAPDDASDGPAGMRVKRNPSTGEVVGE